MKKKLVALMLCSAVMMAGSNVKWVTASLSDLPITAQIANNIANIFSTAIGEDPAVIAAVQTDGMQAAAALTTAEQLVQEYQAASLQDRPIILRNIQAALLSGEQSLQQILAAHIKDPVLAATTATAVGLALSTVQAIVTLLPAAEGVLETGPPTKPLSPDELKKRYNAAVIVAYPQAQI
jgi:hypothetical protein